MPSRRDFLRHASVAGVASAATVSFAAGPVSAAKPPKRTTTTEAATTTTEATTTTAPTTTTTTVAGGDGPDTTGFDVLVAAADAPQAMKDAADFVCSGNNDQATINAALDVVDPDNGGIGGTVHLSPGTFSCSGPVLAARRCSLIGSGRATVLRATTGWTGAVVRARTSNADKIHLAFFGIRADWDNALGGYSPVHGVEFDTPAKPVDDGSPDSTHHVVDLYLFKLGGDGLRVMGGRGITVTRVRAWNVDGCGYRIAAPDGFYSHCETGSSGLSGFIISNSNNRLTNCKSWFSDDHGFELASTAVRNEFAACEAQDNEKHGFYVGAGQVTFTSCHADSNSWTGDLANPNPAFSGFYVKANARWVQLIGCQAYDKMEGDRTSNQKYGFELAGNNQYCQIVGSTRDHVAGALFEGPSITESSIQVFGT